MATDLLCVERNQCIEETASTPLNFAVTVTKCIRWTCGEGQP